MNSTDIYSPIVGSIYPIQIYILQGPNLPPRGPICLEPCILTTIHLGFNMNWNMCFKLMHCVKIVAPWVRIGVNCLIIGQHCVATEDLGLDLIWSDMCILSWRAAVQNLLHSLGFLPAVACTVVQWEWDRKLVFRKTTLLSWANSSKQTSQSNRHFSGRDNSKKRHKRCRQ